MDKCWKRVLLNQFHDVIPGSCIELVVKDAWRIYQSVWNDLAGLQEQYINMDKGKENCVPSVFNPLGWDVSLVMCSSDIDYGTTQTQSVNLDNDEFGDPKERRKLPNQFHAAFLNLQASGYSEFVPIAPKNPVVVSRDPRGVFNISNGKLGLSVQLNHEKPMESLTFILENGNVLDVFQPNSNPGMLCIFDDVPLFWDAWDCIPEHLETKQQLICEGPSSVKLVAEGPLIAAYKWSASIGKNGSSFTRYTILRANSPMLEYLLVIDWKESHKFLKAEFPVNLLAREATYEIQFGHLKRPTHTNTSWDMAKFEVSGHK